MERKTLFKTILYKETGSRHIERNKNCEDNVFRYISENGMEMRLYWNSPNRILITGPTGFTPN